jgi:hypothetical protein
LGISGRNNSDKDLIPSHYGSSMSCHSA